MYSGGYAGRILRVNLSDETSEEEPLSEEMARDFIGGAGFGIKHLFDEVKPGTDPLGPDNKLIFAPGPFTGAGIPCASRMAVTGKSPLTGRRRHGPLGRGVPVRDQVRRVGCHLGRRWTACA